MNDRSVWPIDASGDTEHETAERGVCWCNPRVMQCCPICSGEGCDGCEDGLVEQFTDDPEWPSVTIHNAVNREAAKWAEGETG